MNAVLEPRLEMEPMGTGDIDEVLAIEFSVCPFPWGRGNFVDSLSSGYSCWVCRLDGELVGYFVLMMAVDEAHLLTISVAPKRQKLGFGARLLQPVFRQPLAWRVLDGCIAVFMLALCALLLLRPLD